MIIRKPYAFLIKNFRKIHIALLVIGLFVLYKTIDTANFVNDFMKYVTYDLYANPITKHISFFMNLGIFLMLVGSVSLLFLLMHKKKPWKTYIIPVVVYVSLFLILAMIKGFFNTYTESVEITNLRLSRDLLMILMIAQIPALGIFVMRIFGLDVKKFDFNADLEFLDLSEEDREEIEVSLDFDINTIKRVWKRFKRNFGYFYQEHKFICKAVVAIIIVLFIYNSYVFIFVTHKTYRQGQTYNTNGYSITVNNSYYSNRDYKGDVITKDSNFVVVEITVKNNSAPRNLNTSNFHLKAGSNDFVTTETTYEKEFEDLGTCYKKVKELKRDESITFIIVYKVNKTIPKNRFDLYYQERSGIFKLRKISLKIKDLSKIEKTKKLEFGEYFDIPIVGKEDSISIESIEYTKSIDYKYNKCSYRGCDLDTKTYSVEDGYKIMAVGFSSDFYEAKNMIDFFNKYGRINYKDSKGKAKTQDIKIALKKSYLGKTIYLKVPDDFDKYEDVHLDFIIRNKSYSYQLT